MTAAVFDCNVLIQATGSPNGPSAVCLSLAEAGRFTLVVDDRTLAEYRDVIARPKLRAKYMHVTDDDVNQFLKRLATVSRVVTDVPKVISLPRDPKDAMYLDLAVAAGADYVVTWDKVLLDTTEATSIHPDSVAFRTAYPAIMAVTPPAFLGLLASTP